MEVVRNEKIMLGGMEGKGKGKEIMTRSLVEGSAVVVFSLGDCCMCHVAKHLLVGLGVAPTVIEIDSSSVDIPAVLHDLTGDQRALPAIFIGGKLLGGIESLMACHINGSLVPLLKQAGALWL